MNKSADELLGSYNKITNEYIPALNSKLDYADYLTNIVSLKKILDNLENQIERKNEIIYKQNIEKKHMEDRVKALEEVVSRLLSPKKTGKKDGKQFIVQY
jgi:hypothetical protein